MKVVQYSKKRQGGCMRDEVYRKTKAERERGCKTERKILNETESTRNREKDIK